MDFFEGFLTLEMTVLIVAVFVPLIAAIYLYIYDRRQKQHSVLRNYPILGKVRYFLEMIGPELRQYLFDSDNEARPFSREQYGHIVKRSKYVRDVIGFGSKRDFDRAGYYIRNAMFPLQLEEMKFDRKTTVSTYKYVLLREGLFSRKEVRVRDELCAYLLDEADAVVIGKGCRHPFVVRGPIGMSAMSYGSLGSHAISALSVGLGMARGTWMNTGEGGISPYHLKGDVDLIMQIGPGLFGVRDEEGRLDWEELKRKAELPQVKAIELKLGQGAKIRGGHVDAEKVTPEVAAIRKVKPYQSIDSPNRFREFRDVPSMVDFIERIREVTGKPVGIKIVVGGPDSLMELAAHMKETGKGPDFITVDGGEGGTGASYQELADSVGLPAKSALMIADATLRRFGVRDRVKVIASGKLFSPDRIAVALAMGADLVNIARGFMIAVGCIQSLKCHSNNCPVGVATTDPKLQQALVIEEKCYRVLNYLVSLRQGLFRVAAAAGVDSPVRLKPRHVIYKDEKGVVTSLEEIYRLMTAKVGDLPTG